jgi:hypothetical protein
MPNIRLLYCSAASVGMSYGALVDMMHDARTRNAEHGITGILCYGSGQFLQALEGERHEVNALYHRIAVDARHRDCQLLIVGEIHERAFPEWSMHVVNWDAGDTAGRRAILEAETGRGVFDPASMAADQAIAFLTHLADLERELAAD